MSRLYQEMMGPQKLQIPANIKNMIQMFKGLKNPQALIDTAMKNNPQLKSIIDASNGDYEKAFRDMAKQMNVDPEEIIKLFK